MADVYVIYGRTRWCDGMLADDSRCGGVGELLGAYDTYDVALKAFRACVQQAHAYFVRHPPEALDEDLVADAAEADPLADYNMGNDEYDEGDVQWIYREQPGRSASWQTFPVAVDTTTWEMPVPAGIYLQKLTIEGDNQ